ncbi:MAG: hypothetical protein DRP64_19925, partial [Verrucomicrobia bacterium]
LNGFEKWLGYFGQTTSEGRTQRIDRMHFFDRTLFVDGPTDRYTTGYHPGPAKPQLLNTFPIADGALPSNDWNLQAGIWSVANEEALQSDQNIFAINTVNRDAAANYLTEANLKFTAAQDGEDKAGVLAYYQDINNFVLVGFDRVGDAWYVQAKENGIDTFQWQTNGGSVNYDVYHKIRVTKNAGTFDVRIDDMIPPDFSPVDTIFTGAGLPGLFTFNTAGAFDGIVYTIGWDEFDSGVQGWNEMAGTRSYGTGGVTVNNGYVHKGDLMSEYEFSAQVYQVSGDGHMGLAAVAVDGNNYVNGFIDTAADELVVSGLLGGTALPEQRVSVANKTDYNLRAVKLSDRVIFFVDGIEKITVNETYGASLVGLASWGTSARFNGIMAYRTEPDITPASWVKTDIGAVGFSGTIDYHDNALYMTGSGTDIWATSDMFSFLHTDVNGDWEISTRVINIDESDYWAKASLIFRNDLSANSAMVALHVAPGSYGNSIAQLMWRNSAGEFTTEINVSNLRTAFWIKLKRQGANFSGSYSTDGQNWIAIGTATPPLNASGKLGFGVTAHNNDRIATAVFDNIALIVPLNPGTIGNSQEIYEDEDPAPFTSLESAVGSGTISYQWQWTLTPGDSGSWANLDGETNETYTAPNLNGVYPEDTELFARRKATDTASQEGYSNEVSLKVIKVFDTSGSGLFIDDFNTINTGDVNWEYATRQAGGAGRSTYTDHVNYSIANNALYCEGSGVGIQTTANFARYLVGSDFELSFKLSMNYTGVDWVSVYLVDAASSIWGANDFGVHALGPGNAVAFYINDLSLNDGANNLHVISESEVETALGLESGGYDKTQEHTIQLISTAGTGGTNSYNFVVDGATIKTNLLYTYSDDTARRIDFLSFF